MTFSHNTCWRFLRCSDSLLSSFQWSRSFLCDMPHIPTVGESSFLQACFAVDSRRMICQELVFSGCNLDVLLIIFSSVAHDGLVLLKSLCFTFPHDLFQPAFTVKFMSQLLKAVPCWVLTTDTPPSSLPDIPDQTGSAQPRCYYLKAIRWTVYSSEALREVREHLTKWQLFSVSIRQKSNLLTILLYLIHF